jgi:DNA-directed RNA polymerase subunit RPC12/RpoP
MSPALLRQWHPTLNLPFTPDTATPGSNRYFWWQCAVCQNTFRARLPDLLKTKASGCPYCNGKRVYQGNSLATLYPQVAREWHPTMNGNAGPEQFVGGSHTKAWWQCSVCDMPWQASIKSRTQGRNCPKCIGMTQLRHYVRSNLEDICTEGVNERCDRFCSRFSRSGERVTLIQNAIVSGRIPAAEIRNFAQGLTSVLSSPDLSDWIDNDIIRYMVRRRYNEGNTKKRMRRLTRVVDGLNKSIHNNMET